MPSLGKKCNNTLCNALGWEAGGSSRSRGDTQGNAPLVEYYRLPPNSSSPSCDMTQTKKTIPTVENILEVVCLGLASLDLKENIHDSSFPLPSLDIYTDHCPRLLRLSDGIGVLYTEGLRRLKWAATSSKDPKCSIKRFGDTYSVYDPKQWNKRHLSVAKTHNRKKRPWVSSTNFGIAKANNSLAWWQCQGAGRWEYFLLFTMNHWQMGVSKTSLE